MAEALGYGMKHIRQTCGITWQKHWPMEGSSTSDVRDYIIEALAYGVEHMHQTCGITWWLHLLMEWSIFVRHVGLDGRGTGLWSGAYASDMGD